LEFVDAEDGQIISACNSFLERSNENTDVESFFIKKS
jgi:hypothetical protein